MIARVTMPFGRAPLTRERAQYARASRVSVGRVQPPRARQLLSTEGVIGERKVDRTGVDTRELRALNAVEPLRAIDRTADAQHPAIENVQMDHRGTDVAMREQLLHSRMS